MLSKENIAALFHNLETGNADAFFARVNENVDWTVMGTHPLAGEYSSKSAFFEATFARLNKVLQDGVILKVVDLHVDGNVAIVELRALSTANSGKPFDNTYCWVCTFEDDGQISKVRAYLDSAMVAELFAEN